MNDFPHYSSTVVWSPRDVAYIALCPEFPDLSAFGDSPQEALAELKVVLELAVETHREEGWPLPQPRFVAEHSGQFRARLPRSLHSQLTSRAEAEGVSLNTLVVHLLSTALGRAEALDQAGRSIRAVLAQLHSSLAGLIGTRPRIVSGTTTSHVPLRPQDPLLRHLYQEAGTLPQESSTEQTATPVERESA
jgi:predicted RNase H-like HicB family nuclease